METEITIIFLNVRVDAINIIRHIYLCI